MEKLFGTFGIRRIVNEVLTPDFALKLAYSFGTYINREIVVVGRDARKHSEMIYDAVISGLLACGCQVIELGLTATPTLQWACRQWDAWGAMITASHNPPQWNGIKFMEKTGKGLDREKDVDVEKIFYSEKYHLVPWTDVPQKTIKRDVNDDYIRAIVAKVNLPLIQQSRFRIVVDCANGAPCLITPQLLSDLGCRVVSLNAHPDGRFPGRNPEPTPDNLTDLTTLITHASFHIGFAQDGDGDRLIVIRPNGEFVPGDYSVSLVANELASQNIPGPIVTTVATSSMLKDIAIKTGRGFLATAVGDLVVAKALQENKGIFGCEENGGMIFPDFVWGRDGAIAAARILHIMATKEKSLDDLLKELPQYFQIKMKKPVNPEKKEKILSEIDRLTSEEENRITIDGYKVFYPDGSWLLIRPSGTEPLLRIFAESRDAERAQAIVQKYIDIINSILYLVFLCRGEIYCTQF